jgi:regulator of nonsense transcripts 1
MIQFSRPKKSLQAALDPFRRHESPAHDYLDKGRVPPPTAGAAAGRFDPAYYRTHDPISYVPADAQSVVSQAISSFPLHTPFPAGKGRTYTGYASSVISQQQGDTASIADSASVIGGNGHGHLPVSSRIAYSQYDRVGPNGAVGEGRPGARRRLSVGSIAPSDAPTASMYAFGYKAGDDDAQSIAPSQAGVTDF